MGYGFRSEGRSEGRSGGRSEGGYGGRRSGGGGYRPGGGGFRRSTHGASDAPVKEGEVVEVLIESVGEKGDGIAKVKGFVIFIPNAKEGDAVKVKITKVLSKVGFGEVVGKADPANIGKETKKVSKKDSFEKEGVSDQKSDEPTESEEVSTEFENEDDAEEESEEF